MPISLTLALYLLAFVTIWYGSNLVITSIGKLAKNLKLPQFTISFFILGLLTSLPELAIGITSVTNNDPEIFVGNLIGASIVLFLLVIPLLSLTGTNIKTPMALRSHTLVAILLVVFLPTILSYDKRIEIWEGVLAVGSFVGLIFFMSKERSVSEKIASILQVKHQASGKDGIKVLVGIFLLLVSSNYIVDTTLYFAQMLKIAPFFVSLIIVSLGTNIPELSLVFRSIQNKKQEIALADFLGSAAVNTLLFGVLTLVYPNTILIPNHFFHRTLFIIVGLVFFYLFMRSRNILNKKESFVLVALYVCFIIYELLVIT